MADEKIRVDIESHYDDGDAKDALKDAEKIDKATPTLEVGADTSDADAKVGAIADEAERLTSRDWITKILTDTGAAKSDLQALEGELDQTREHAERANTELDRTTGGGEGSKLRGNAIADLTGPLGDASGAASDFAGVFDGLGDTVEAFASKAGLSEAAAGGLASAVGGLGVVVAAGAAAWTLWKGRQEEAAKKAKELLDTQTKLNDAIAKGDRAAATADFQKLYGPALKGADALGLSTQQLVDYITGVSDVLPGVNEHIGRYQKLAADAGGAVNQWTNEGRANYDAIANQTDALVGANDELVKARDRYEDLNGKTKDATAANDDLATALLGPEKKLTAVGKAADTAGTKVDELTDSYGRLNDRLSGRRAIEDWQKAMTDAQKAVSDGNADTVVDIRGVEDAIVAAGEAAKLNPIDVETAIQKADQGDIDGAFLFMQGKIDEKGPLQVAVALHATIPKLKLGGRGGTSIVVEVDPTAAAAVGATTVNVNMPRGSRGVDVVRQIQGHTRRSGRRYGGEVVRR